VDDEPLNFERHRRRVADAGTVRCARCGERIVATTTRCPECGVHFRGEAQDFAHPSERTRGGPPGWVVAVAVLLLAATAIGLLGLR
jgi:predicted amidophosphoribosyltransferase